MTRDEILKLIKENKECSRGCFVHNLITHNTCLLCKAFKNSPYHQSYIRNKTDEEIAYDIYCQIKEEGLDEED